jgi:15-hydroxyprostaglandin dehydrogenase (NAD)
MREYWPKEHFTSVTAILRAFDAFLGNDKLAGKILEVSGQEQFFRKPVEYSNETQRWTYEDSGSLFRKFETMKASL